MLNEELMAASNNVQSNAEIMNLMISQHEECMQSENIDIHGDDDRHRNAKMVKKSFYIQCFDIKNTTLK